MKLVRRLFKKFASLDSNEYYSAVINNEIYFGISSIFRYNRAILGGLFALKTVEEQYFHTMKVPEIILQLLVRFVDLEDGESFWLQEEIDKIEDQLSDATVAMFGALAESIDEADPNRDTKLADILKRSKDRISSNVELFANSWKNASLTDYLNHDWHFVFKEYAGVATRNIYLARVQEDLMTVLMIKLFGNDKDNEVVEVKRLLMDKDLIIAFLDNTLKGEK